MLRGARSGCMCEHSEVYAVFWVCFCYMTGLDWCFDTLLQSCQETGNLLHQLTFCSFTLFSSTSRSFTAIVRLVTIHRIATVVFSSELFARLHRLFCLFLLIIQNNFAYLTARAVLCVD
jgi:hypothetical protein